MLHNIFMSGVNNTGRHWNIDGQAGSDYCTCNVTHCYVFLGGKSFHSCLPPHAVDFHMEFRSENHLSKGLAHVQTLNNDKYFAIFETMPHPQAKAISFFSWYKNHPHADNQYQFTSVLPIESTKRHTKDLKWLSPRPPVDYS